MNKRQAKIEALSVCAEILYDLTDDPFGDELSEEDSEKLLEAVKDLAQRLWERSMKLQERNG